ncbi:MAG: hypothetical protein ACE366_27030 [Bradymonadia bacterium]
MTTPLRTRRVHALNTLKWLAPFLFILMGHGSCGPRGPEAALATLMSVPAVLLVGCLLLFSLEAPWARISPPRTVKTSPWRRWQWLLGGSLLFSLICLFVPLGREAVEWSLFAVPVFGGSWLTFMLIAWRYLRHIDPTGARAVRASPVIALGITLWPVIPLFASSGEAPGELLAFWFYTGVLGAVGGVIWLLLMAEAWWRALHTDR